MKIEVSEAPEPEESPAKSVTVDVKSSTQVSQFLPFTALPARYHGKRVELVIVGDIE